MADSLTDERDDTRGGWMMKGKHFIWSDSRGNLLTYLGTSFGASTQSEAASTQIRQSKHVQPKVNTQTIDSTIIISNLIEPI